MFNTHFTLVGLFHRLMSRIAQLVGKKVQLYYRQIYFPVGRNHWVIIEMLPHPEALIKVNNYADDGMLKYKLPSKDSPFEMYQPIALQ